MSKFISTLILLFSYFISTLILLFSYFIPTLILLHYNRNDKLALIAAIFPIRGNNYSHTGKIIFPAWE